jgi:hypothetical protein
MEITQRGKCALCRQNRELQLSHIVPHFVGRKLKKTALGNIRVTNEPNKVVQDIEKHFLLCHDCEEAFSVGETWFATQIFNPYQDKTKTEFDYDKNLTRFIISLSWRSLYLDLEEFSVNPDFNQDILMTLFQSEQVMRDYLLGKRDDITTLENHIFFLDRIRSATNLNVAQNPSAAMHRSISSYTVYYGKTSFTVSNLMGIMIVTFYSMDTNEQWSNTKIDFVGGTLKAQNQQMASVVGNEIQHWMDEGTEAQCELSETQKKKIEDNMRKAGDKIKNYPFFQDLDDDMKLSQLKNSDAYDEDSN